LDKLNESAIGSVITLEKNQLLEKATG